MYQFIVNLNVVTDLPRVEVDKASVVAEIGQDIMLNCTVTGSPQPTMRWLRYNSQPLVLGNQQYLTTDVLYFTYTRSETVLVHVFILQTYLKFIFC